MNLKLFRRIDVLFFFIKDKLPLGIESEVPSIWLCSNDNKLNFHDNPTAESFLKEILYSAITIS